MGAALQHSTPRSSLTLRVPLFSLQSEFDSMLLWSSFNVTEAAACNMSTVPFGEVEGEADLVDSKVAVVEHQVVRQILL